MEALWPQVQVFVKRACGVVLNDDQSYLLEPRLTPVQREFGFCSLAELAGKLRAAQRGSPLAVAVVDAMTTHESLFFRDPQFWSTLGDRVMPELIARASGRALRFWSAACAHGQEPYSLAILLEEKWPAVAATAEILATDVSQPAVERAQRGVYSPLEVTRGLGAMRLLRHFEKEPGGFRIKRKLRERVKFNVHNLLGQNTDPSGCDVVMCRNVLIYFADADRKATLRRIEASIRPGGYIALGGTETGPRAPLSPGWYEKQSAERTVNP